ncbi:DUF4215 domain-containing protein [Chondromyces apiculatus]|uniref:P/Homo B domain-containing protein n=1 Tax=Chondromyces apiculatus DSM 436 TaxID=1192034 RepID=A0A017T3R0_9BACT|nr:DUF4215 domain-containing protein [Chondromyces apiculatus]EYF03465.1 Hypothetical protein CAP_5449 [Chondromyces apiculatus DSM 436]
MRTLAGRSLLAVGLALLAGVVASAASCTLDVMGTGPDGATVGEGGAGGDGSAGGGGQGSAGEGGAGGSIEVPVDPVCGNGVIEAPETCDDGNEIENDGCTQCVMDDRFTCENQPSECVPITPIIAGLTGLDIGIPDNESYNGSPDSMACITLPVTAAEALRVQRVELLVGIEHDWVGDLVIKVVNPEGEVTTVMNRPVMDEPVDAATEPNGANANIRKSNPVRFADDAAASAEDMGENLSTGQAVCRDGGSPCTYKPAPGKGPGDGFATFKDRVTAGDWKVCVADGNSNYSGELDQAEISLWAR